ncbi:MAG: methionine--tRNA ligase [bacterium]|nr:methionine--tRNA ligase [bacterium]
MKSYYITTTLPYVNAEPHIGHAMEFIRADVIAREKKVEGFDVFFNTGTDEHGLKVYEKALGFSEDPKAYVDRCMIQFKSLKDTLGLSDDLHFVRTTDPHHIMAAQEFWKICDKNGYIYKKNYKTKYCPGCELEKTDIEIENGRCFIHQSIDLIIIEEENYFFKFSEFQKPILSLYEENPDFVIPSFRFNEIKSFVKNGLTDFSISRLRSKMSWGVPVPGDDDHVMYVWFDALVSYISTIGWPDDKESFDRWWIKSGGVVQYCGKDNLRQQSAMWQAMLMAAGLPNSKQIVINGFITGEGGIKMSKTLGNTINPIEVVKEYGTDALRYFLLREIHPFEDSPFTLDKFKESYNAHLANGLGNLVSRVMKMAETNDIRLEKKEDVDTRKYSDLYDSYEINKVCNDIWSRIQSADKYIQEHEPFKTIKADKEKGKLEITYLLGEVAHIGILLAPILPETSAKIAKAIEENKIANPLFIRK